MRLLHIIMAAVTIACGVLLLTWHNQQGVDERKALEDTRQALERLDAQIKFRAAVSGNADAGAAEVEIDAAANDITTTVNQRGWPTTIDAQWFGNNPPLNALVPPGCPWVEVASGEELNLTNPNVRVALDRTTASFWYNPALGIVRARVGPTATDQRAVDLYNELNSTNVATVVDAISATGLSDASGK
jgi:hypothetical protein